jgi:hypothetical protein
VFPRKLRQEASGNMPTLFADGYDGYLLHLSMVMG